jgi:CHAT domain-containing protein
LFSFRLGDRQSWAWEVTDRSITLRTLGGRKQLQSLIKSFGQTIGKADPAETGARLFQEIFGQSNPDTSGRKRWLLALEGELFNVPFPALPLASGQPLIVAHSVQIVPGARMLARQSSRSDLNGPFLAVGDPVYNNADPRSQSSASQRAPALLSRISFDMAGNAAAPEFARLWGAGKEMSESARAWGARDSILLAGPDASAASFWTAMERKPSIIHFATHVVEKSDRLNTGWIALSKSLNGQLDYLTPEQISARTVSARLVVLSGCSSGKAEVLNASGLMGLTRAWIAGGAGSVLATYWPTVDDDGIFFQSFYRHLRANPDSGPAEALRQASIEMLNSRTWRSSPSFWAGYFLVGK